MDEIRHGQKAAVDFAIHTHWILFIPIMRISYLINFQPL